MSDVLGLPLLSGPPPLAEQGDACRKCNKEFNMFLNRSRKCNHCGYYYCHSCTDYQAIMPRTGQDTQAGYDIMNVCAFCIDQLNVTAATKSQLKNMPLSKLRKYVDAYNIKIDRVVEKDDIIEAIQNARSPNGCLPAANENYYRKHSVPNRTSGQTRRGFFSSRPTPDPPSSRPPPRPATTRPTHNFPRPDLEPDHPLPPPPRHHSGPTQGAPPQPPPRPQPFYTLPQQPYPQPHGHNQYGHPPYNPHTRPTGYAQPAPPPPPPRDSRPGYPPPPPHYSHPYAQPHAQHPAQGGYYQNPTASRSSHNIHQTSSTSTGPSTGTPPRPRAASAAPPPTAPPPTLDELLSMSPESIAALSIGTLKAVLFNNHVNAGLVLEKGDLVHKVQSLIEDERRERQRQREAEESEERERIEREREMLEEYSRARQEQEERERAQNEQVQQEGAETEAAIPEPEEIRPLDAEAPKPVSKSPPPTPPKPSMQERTGLCVICQDEEANIAIVDCGHLAMCRGCSELIMNSSRECPLCRTRIVTEARLLRIFKP